MKKIYRILLGLIILLTDAAWFTKVVTWTIEKDVEQMTDVQILFTGFYVAIAALIFSCVVGAVFFFLFRIGKTKIPFNERKFSVREGYTAHPKIIEKIKKFNITDVDAPVFTHTKDFEQHFDYIKEMLLKKLT